MKSNPVMIALFTFLAIATVVAQESPPARPHVSISRFGGLIDNDPNSAPLGNALDMANFDILQTGSVFSIKKRRGFGKVGQTFTDKDIWGVHIYAPSNKNKKIVAVADEAVYEYDEASNTFIQLSWSGLTGTCAVTNGSDTIRGIGTLWWELGNYDLDSIRIQDTDSTRSKAIRHILSDSILIINGTWLGATNASRACTLKTVGYSTEMGLSESFNPEGETYGDMLLDTLVITGPANRVRYASREVGLGQSALFDSVKFGRMGEYDQYQKYMRVYYSGAKPAGSGYWWQFMRKYGTGTQEWRNISLRKIGAWDYFAVDTLIELMFDEGTAENGKWKILPITDTVFNVEIFKGTIAGWDTTTIRKAGCGLADIIEVTTTIRSTNVSGSPNTWSIDSLNGRTVLPMIDTGAGMSREFVRCEFRVPLSLVTVGDTTCIRFTQYPGGGCTPPIIWANTGDSIILVTNGYGDNALSGADSLSVESWTWPVQFMWSPSRLGYFGNSNESVDSLGYSAIKILKGLEIDDDSTDQIFTVAQDDGRKITAAINIGDYVYVHKGGEEIYQISFSTIGLADQIVSTNTGFSALHQKGVGHWRGNMIYVTPLGMHAGVGIGARRLSSQINSYWRDSIADGSIDDVRLRIFGDKAFVSYKRGGQNAADRTLIYDFLTNNWYKYSFGMGETALLGNEVDSDSLVFGSPIGVTSGAVFMLGRTESDSGTVADCYYRTGWFPVENTMSLYGFDRYSMTRWLGWGDTVQFRAWNDYGSSAVVSDNITSATAATWGVSNRFANSSRLGAVWSFQVGSDTNSDSLHISSLELDFVRRSMRPRR